MPFLYGKTDEKFVKADISTKNQKLKPLGTYKFHLCAELEGNPKTKPCEVSIRLRTSPDKLIELCSAVLDGIPLPYPFYWDTLEVANWIRKLGFPQYQNTFKKNQINGRSLIRLDASYLVRMNIKNFNHLRTITHAIRHLYGFEKSSFNRCISIPHRDLDGLYKFYRMRIGPKYETVRRTDVARMYHLIRPHSLYETHWQSLERWLKHSDPNETEHIGAIIRRKNTMYAPRKGESSSLVHHNQKKIYRDCSGIPPCMCNWTEEVDLRKPWQLKCLGKRNTIHHKMKTPEKCRCFEICSCYHQPQNGLTLLKKYIPHKYGTRYL